MLDVQSLVGGPNRASRAVEGQWPPPLSLYYSLCSVWPNPAVISGKLLYTISNEVLPTALDNAYDAPAGIVFLF